MARIVAVDKNFPTTISELFSGKEKRSISVLFSRSRESDFIVSMGTIKRNAIDTSSSA